MILACKKVGKRLEEHKGKRMFAVIKTGGKQYKVAANDVIKVEKLDGDSGDNITFSNVMMITGGKDTHIGAPFIDGASVIGEVVTQGRGKKIIVFKKRRRQNSRRKNGHRQHFTEIRITDILTAGQKPAPKKKAAAAKKDTPAQSEEPAAKETKAKAAAKKPTESKASDTSDAPKPLFKAPDGKKDDLKKISGVGPVLEKKLNALGITTYAQIAEFKKADIDQVDEVLNFKGRIERDDWLEQAKTLDAEK
jgi:large subunit ribosomal protein L21